jgi:hypothetical protein
MAGLTGAVVVSIATDSIIQDNGSHDLFSGRHAREACLELCREACVIFRVNDEPVGVVVKQTTSWRIGII